MPTDRAGYTVTMLLVDTSPSMGKIRTVELPEGPNGEPRSTEMTNLEWAMQFVKLKIQEMIFSGRKTEQCGVIAFGTEETDNIINQQNGGYDNVLEYIPIAQPTASTLAMLDALQPSETIGDPVDALIVGIETQRIYLSSKRTWTRKIVLITDGESPIEIEDWEATTKKMNELQTSLTIIGVDFDDEEYPYHEDDKSTIKRANEEFFHTFTESLDAGVLGTCALALRETTRPDIKQVKSTLMGTTLRLGDVDVRPEEALEVIVKASKCTAVSRPKSWKKFGRRESEVDTDGDVNMIGAKDKEKERDIYVELKMRTEYFIDRSEGQEDEGGGEEDGEEHPQKDETIENVEKEQLVKGFKYGSTYAPCPDGQFPRLETRKGIDICGFFSAKNFRRDQPLGEVQYIWADPSSPQQQVALSSIVQAMYEKGSMAIARWVSRDGMDPKMGVLSPSVFEKVDCLLWVQMPFADDVRKYTFASLEKLVSKKGEVITKHPYLPTEEQMDVMDRFVDAMDLMEAGEKDEDGVRLPWFDTRLSYNPALHRTKQALFHSAVVSDVTAHPIPPPHPELLKYFDPPKRVLKRAREVTAECLDSFKVKEVPKKVARIRKDGHVRARDEDDETLLLDLKPASSRPLTQTASRVYAGPSSSASPKKKKLNANDSATESDTEDEEELLLDQKGAPPDRPPLPTPARSESPSPPIDPGRAPGMIIGTVYPLEDFKKNIAVGDVVSKAVEDLGVVVREIIGQPFGSRRSSEMVECMKALRDVCLKEDEIDAWNTFLRALREQCLSTNFNNNKAFWKDIQKVGRKLSLISKREAAKQGGDSEVGDSEAEEFLRD